MAPIYSMSRLRAHGKGSKAVRRLVRDELLVRLRRGWYATPDVDVDTRLAVSTGGKLTCVSALKRHGVWTMPHADLHVRVARGTAVRLGERTRVHWTHDRIDLALPLDDVETALLIAVECLDLRAAVVVVDSVLNRGLVSRSGIELLLDKSPRGRRVLVLCDGRAESGIETIARLALRRLRVRVRSQVTIPGVGRVDLLIGDRLVLELDGRQWHDDFEADRTRDRQLMALGYLVVRASYRQVMEEWATVEAQLLVLVRRKEHRWRTTLPQGARRGSARAEHAPG
jgi:very-short-patch-repair endonuclease